MRNADALTMKRLSFVAASIICIHGALAADARAALVTYNFTGTVTSVDPRLSGTFNTSQTLSGSFTYESTTEGILFGQETEGLSHYESALTDFTMTVGSYTAAPPFGSDIFSGVAVVNQPANDWFVLDSRLEAAEVIGFKPLARISFVDASGTSFEDTKLANLGDLSDWLTRPDHIARWYLAFSSDEGEPNVSGPLTSITAAPVPEPGTGGALLASGICLMALIGRRRCFRF